VLSNAINFPAELREDKLWCNWRLVQRGDKKPTKVPFQPSGAPASSTDSSTWSTFEGVCTAANRFDGIGVFCNGTYTFIDLDNCVKDGVIEPWALAALARINSYTELSPSGTGVHAFVRGTVSKPAKINGCEIYSVARYFTVTGNALLDYPATICEMDATELEELRDDIANDQLRPAQPASPAQPSRRPLVIERYLTHAERVAKLERVLTGDISEYGHDRSAAVYGALQLLARKHAGDAEQIQEEFEGSALCADWGEKWNRLGESEIQKAVMHWRDNGNPAWGEAQNNRTLADALKQFNSEYCYVNQGHIVVQLSTRMVMTADQFRGAHAANKFAVQDDGTTRKRVSIAKAWLEWPERRRVERMVYEPGKPEFFESQLNRWRGWACDPVEGDTTLWEELLANVFNGDESSRQWFEQWCAFQFQEPGKKMAVAVILWGVLQGTGKTTIGETLRRIFGDNSALICEEQLHAPFNEWAADKQFILADEITGTGDKRTHSDQLKLMVTRSTIHVNKKFEPPYAIRDSINYLFTSNHCNSFYVADSDRRYFVWEVAGPALDGDFFARYYKWLDNSGASAVFHRLLNLDLAGFQPYQAPPRTAAKEEMIQQGWSELDRWVRQQIAEPEALISKGGDVWTAAKLVGRYELANIGDRGVKVKQAGMSAALKNAGLRSLRIRKRGFGDYYCYGFGAGWYERPEAEWIAEYASHHG
jgi:hypothetical protein